VQLIKHLLFAFEFGYFDEGVHIISGVNNLFYQL